MSTFAAPRGGLVRGKILELLVERNDELLSPSSTNTCS